jgi:hypothetical protein
VIDAYGFGSMTVDGVRYDRDLIVPSDGAPAEWRRGEGHRLRWEDLAAAVNSVLPESVVIGTGKFGRMRVDREIAGILERRGIVLWFGRTDRAFRVFNDGVASGTRCLAAFHLTC